MAESLPPLTIPQLESALANPNFSDYVYFGLEADKGWKVALVVHKLIPALRVYRVEPSMQAVVRAKLALDDKVAGAVFGWDIVVRDRLTKTRAENAMAVIEAIQEAREATAPVEP